MNLFANIKAEVTRILQDLQKEGKLPADLALEGYDVTPPRDTSHGEMALNAAMVLAGKAKMNPMAIAELVAEKCWALPHVTQVDIAKPGFINLRFKPAFWHQLLPVVLEQKERYGQSATGKGRRVNVEYASVNPTGPVHVGHVRGAVYGDVLAGLLQHAGFKVTKEYYINDSGAQTETLAQSVYWRYCEALGDQIGEIGEGLYPGEYLIPVGEALAKEYGNKWHNKPKSEWMPVFKPFAIEKMMEMIKSDLALLGIHHDVFTSEKALTDAGKVDEAVKVLEDKGLVYVGVLEPPKGKIVEDWEPRPQTLFKSSEFGDDLDRPLKKSDGGWTYFAPDIAYHFDKYQRGHELMVDVLGADHGGYAKRIKAAVDAITGGKAELEVRFCQMVKFLRNGEPAKMSKRAGTFITAREVVEEVGKDVLRFMMLTRKNDAPLDFDFVKVTEQSKDNPVFYVQYAHARIHSVWRNCREQLPQAVTLAEKPVNGLFAHLHHEEELATIQKMADWPRVVEGAAIACEPHRIAFYLQELAETFHALWTRGNEEFSLRFIQKDAIELTAARLLLVKSLATVIASGLNVLGIEPVEEMR